MLKCSFDKIDSVFEEIAKTAKLYIPSEDNDGSAVYKQWEKGVLWSDALNTVRSPKDFFFPQMENLMEFKTDGKELVDSAGFFFCGFSYDHLVSSSLESGLFADCFFLNRSGRNTARISAAPMPMAT